MRSSAEEISFRFDRRRGRRARYQRALAQAETPDRLYREAVVLATVLAAVLQGLREEYVAAGREQVFKRLEKLPDRRRVTGARPTRRATWG